VASQADAQLPSSRHTSIVRLLSRGAMVHGWRPEWTVPAAPDPWCQVARMEAGFALLGQQDAGVRLRSDVRLVPADSGLPEAASGIAGCLLPSHTAPLSDEPDATVALDLSDRAPVG
jgi:hypothetical protein